MIGKNLSQSHTQENGIHQGFVISSVLFNIAIDDITTIIQNPGIYSLYAGGFVIFLTSGDPSLGQKILQQSIDKLNQWTLKNGFQLSKTNPLPFTSVECAALIILSTYISEITLFLIPKNRIFGLNFRPKINLGPICRPFEKFMP